MLMPDGMKLSPQFDRIVKIAIAGHSEYKRGGYLGGLWDSQANTSDFTTVKLKDPQSAQARLLAYLKPFTEGHCDVTLKACYQAIDPEGKDFMLKMAQSLGANIIGFDDEYAFRGWGNEWKVDPLGNWSMTKGKPLYSLLDGFNSPAYLSGMTF